MDRKVLPALAGIGGLALAILVWRFPGPSEANQDHVPLIASSPQIDGRASDQALRGPHTQASTADTPTNAIGAESHNPSDFVSPSGFKARNPAIAFPEGSLSSYIDTYMQRAADGDSEAAYVVWYGLNSCRDTPATAEDLVAATNSLRQTHVVSGVYQQNIEHQLTSLQERFDFCEGIPPALRADSFRWLDLAADQGLGLARVTYFVFFEDPSLTSSEYDARKSKALAMLQDEAYTQGNYDALLHIAMSAEAGRYFAQSDVEAYAHFYVAQTLLPTPLVQQKLDQLQTELNQADLQQSLSRAAEIRSMCCETNEGNRS